MSTKCIQDFKIDGIITAPFTPFKGNGEIDFDKFESYAQHIMEYKNTCVFANGTTGEGLSMTIQERKDAAVQWMKVAKNRFQMIVNVSAVNILDARELAAHSESIGADAISAMTPLFYKPPDVETLVECLKKIASAAPNTPFYYYDINFMTGTNFDNGDVFNLAIEKIPTFRGMKQSSREVAYLVKSIMNSHKGKYQVIQGNELLLPGLPLGVRVPVCMTFCGRIFSRMVEAFDRGDMIAAMEEQKKIQSIQDLLQRHGEHGMKKAMSSLLNMDVGPSRLPNVTPSEQQIIKLKAAMEEIDLASLL